MTTYILKYFDQVAKANEEVAITINNSNYTPTDTDLELQPFKSNPIDNIHLFYTGLTNSNGDYNELRFVFDGTTGSILKQEIVTRPTIDDEHLIEVSTWDYDNISTLSFGAYSTPPTIKSYEFTRAGVTRGGVLGDPVDPTYDTNVPGINIGAYLSPFNNEYGVLVYTIDGNNSESFIKVLKYDAGFISEKLLAVPSLLNSNEWGSNSFVADGHLIFSNLTADAATASARNWKINLEEFYNNPQNPVWERITREAKDSVTPHTGAYIQWNKPKDIYDHVNDQRYDLEAGIYNGYTLGENTSNKFKIAALELAKGEDRKIVVYDTHMERMLFVKDLVPGERLLKALDGDEFYETITTTPTNDGKSQTINIQKHYFGLSNTLSYSDTPRDIATFDIPIAPPNSWTSIHEWVQPNGSNSFGYLITSTSNYSNNGESNQKFQIYKVDTAHQYNNVLSISPPPTGSSIEWMDYGFIKDGQLHLKTFSDFVNWENNQFTRSHWELQSNNAWKKIDKDQFQDERSSAIGRDSIIRIDDQGIDLHLIDPNPKYREILNNPQDSITKIPGSLNINKYLVKLEVFDETSPVDYEQWMVIDTTGAGSVLAQKTFNDLDVGLQLRAVSNSNTNSSFVYFQELAADFSTKDKILIGDNINLHRIALTDIENALKDGNAKSIANNSNLHLTLKNSDLIGRPLLSNSSNNEIVFFESTFDIGELASGLTNSTDSVHTIGLWNSINEDASNKLVVRVADDGNIVSRTWLGKGDTEDLVFDPKSGNLFIQVEEDNQVDWYWINTHNGLKVPITEQEFSYIKTVQTTPAADLGWYMSTTATGFNNVMALMVEKTNTSAPGDALQLGKPIELHLLNQKSGQHLGSQDLKPSQYLVPSADTDHFYLLEVLNNTGSTTPHTWKITQNSFAGINKDDQLFQTPETWEIPMDQGLNYPAQWVEFFTPFDETGNGFISINSNTNNNPLNEGSKFYKISIPTEENPDNIITVDPFDPPSTINTFIHASSPAFIFDEHLWLGVTTYPTSTRDVAQSLTWETFKYPISLTDPDPKWISVEGGSFSAALEEYQFALDITDFDTHGDKGLIKFFDIDDGFDVDFRPIDLVQFNEGMLARASIESSTLEGTLPFEKWVLLDSTQDPLVSAEFAGDKLRTVHAPGNEDNVYFQVVKAQYEYKDGSDEVISFTQPNMNATTLYKVEFSKLQNFIEKYDNTVTLTDSYLSGIGAEKVRDLSQAQLHGSPPLTNLNQLAALHSYWEKDTIGNTQAVAINQTTRMNGDNEIVFTRYNPNGSVASLERKPGYLEDLYVDHDRGIMVMRTETKTDDRYYIADVKTGRIANTREGFFNDVSKDIANGGLNPDWTFVFGNHSNDAMLGNATSTQKQYIFSGLGTDNLQGGFGNDAFVGEGGVNTVVYKDSIQNFSFKTNDEGNYLRLYSPTWASDTFININAIKFDDATVNFMPVPQGSVDVFNLKVTYTNNSDIVVTADDRSTVAFKEVLAGGGNDFISVGRHTTDVVILGEAGDDVFMLKSSDRAEGKVELHGGVGNDIYAVGLNNLGRANGITQLVDAGGANRLVLAVNKPASGLHFSQGVSYEWNGSGLRVSSANNNTLLSANLNAIQQIAFTYNGTDFGNTFLSGNLINPTAAQLTNGTLLGTATNDVLLPIAGVLLNYNGGAGDDVIIMNNVSGGKVAGGAGNDTIVVQNGVADGPEPTRHTLSFEWAPAGATSEIRLDYGFAYVMSNTGALLGTDRFESQYFNGVVAGGANDVIYGNRYANQLDGGAGNDVIYSGRNHAFEERNVLIGGVGNDILVSETQWSNTRSASTFSGSLMQGGAGDDVYVMYEKGAPATAGSERFAPNIVSERNPNGSNAGGNDTVRFLSDGEGFESLGYIQNGRTIQVNVNSPSFDFSELSVGDTLMLNFANGQTENNGYTVTKVIHDTTQVDRPVVGFEVLSPLSANQTGSVVVTNLDWSGDTGLWTDDGYYAFFDVQNSSESALKQVANGNNMLTYYDGEKVSTPLSLIGLVDRNAMEFIEVGSNNELQAGIKVPVSFNSGTKSTFETILPGANGNAVLFGGAGTDFINDSSFSDILIGGEGHDMVSSNFGNDVVLSGAGNDFLSFRSDGQVVVGGAGADHFQVAGVNNAAALITDFKPKEGDRLSIDEDWLDQYFSTRTFDEENRKEDALEKEELLDMASFYLKSVDRREHLVDVLIFDEKQVAKAYEQLNASIIDHDALNSI